MSGHQPTIERPRLNRAARALSKHIFALIREDWTNKRLLVMHPQRGCIAPKNWQGWPVEVVK
jgi:hypothetical protein